MLEVWRDAGYIYIYCKKARLVYRSTATSGAVLKSKCNLIIQHPPFWEYITQWFTTWFIGDVDSGALLSKSMDSLGQQFLDLLDQASWCHVGMARSSWLHRCGMGCHRLWCRGILLNSWCGRNSWSLFHLGCQCCRCSRCGLHAWCRWGWCRLCH